MEGSKKSRPKTTKEPLDVAEVKPVKTWNASNILWGSLLVLLGTVFLLHNFGVINIDLTNAWRLWPVFIIAAGVSIMSVRGLLGGIIMTVLVLIVLGLTSFVMLGGAKPNDSDSTTQQKIFDISTSSDEVKKAKIDVNAGAGNLNFDSSRAVSVVKGNLDSSFASLKTNSTVKDSLQTVDLTVEGNSGWWAGDYKNDLGVTLGTTLPYELSVDSGASRINADLSEVWLEKLHLKSGASEIEIKLGDRAPSLDVTFDIGVSSAVFKLPRSAGIRLELDSGLSGVNIDGLKEINEGSYQSENYNTAEKKIELKGEIGVSNLRVEYY